MNEKDIMSHAYQRWFMCGLIMVVWTLALAGCDTEANEEAQVVDDASKVEQIRDEHGMNPTVINKQPRVVDVETDSELIETAIDAKAPMRFEPRRFVVPPGAEVALTVENLDDMQHNLLITRPGTRENVVQAALELGGDGASKAYVPDGDDVLEATAILIAGESETLWFTAPEEQGVYPYVCTIPGHGTLMFGAMYVGEDVDLPPPAEDPHIPNPGERDAEALAAAHNEHPEMDGRTQGELPQWHAYEVTLPVVYRIVMREASPASIAIGLPNGEWVCWDATPARLRYVRSGGPLDPEPHWSGKGADPAEITGEIWYRENVGFPLRFGTAESEPGHVQFQGYDLDEEGYPEFHYTADGVEIAERIAENPGGSGVERRFRIEQADGPVWFVAPSDTDATFNSTAGEWAGSRLELSTSEASEFAVTVEPGEE